MTRPSPPKCRTAVAVLALSALLLHGCASPGQPTQQPLRVETPGCPQAQCRLDNDRGHWIVPSTPASVTVTTSHVPLRVICHGPGGQAGQAGAVSSLRSAGVEGAVIGGVVGTGVGVAAAAPAMAFIPPLGAILVVLGAAVGTGSGQAVDSQRRAIVYPGVITVPMNCATAADVAPGVSRAALGFAVRGLTPAQRQASGAGEAAALQVTEVAAGGAAERAGLRAGDLLLAADGRPLADADALQTRVQALAAGDRLSLGVWRAGQAVDVVLVQPAPP